ncbi:MAG: hypothetical protein KDD66_05265 [Bdellovibrionales bacterium]|nr:hypothetical protein [Bdellovibrionales bacterium]
MSSHFRTRFSVSAPLAALLVLGTTACGNIWTTPSSGDYAANDQGAVEPAATEDSGPLLSTTGASAAVGAVIGGTAGLIIGSSTGNAGEGVVLGSLTGAAVGGLIGNEIENGEEINAEQDDVLRRHEEILKKQQRELEDLRRMGGSDQMTSAAPLQKSTIKPPAPVLSSAQQNIQTQDLLEKREIKRWLPKDQEPALPPAARARLKEGPVIDTPEGKRVYLQAPSQPINSDITEVRSKSASRSTQQLAMNTPKPKAKPVVEREIVSEPAKKPAKAMDKAALSKPAPIKPALTAPAADTIARPAPQAVTPAGNKCMLAEAEAERARNAASDADKLFYYRRAIQLCPSTAVYHIEIGRVYIDIGRQEDAEFEFRRALDLDPDNRQAQDQLTLLQAGE